MRKSEDQQIHPPDSSRELGWPSHRRGVHQLSSKPVGPIACVARWSLKASRHTVKRWRPGVAEVLVRDGVAGV